MAGAKWTVDETIALMQKMVQETMEEIASNKELHEQLQQMKEQSNVNRTPQQIETKLRAPRCLSNIPFSVTAVSRHSVLVRAPSLDEALVSICAKP